MILIRDAKSDEVIGFERLYYLAEGKGQSVTVETVPEGDRSMKVQYNREDDVLMIHLSEDKIDHAEQTDGVIVHFSPEDRPVLLEVLDASDFLARLTKIIATVQADQLVSI